MVRTQPRPVTSSRSSCLALAAPAVRRDRQRVRERLWHYFASRWRPATATARPGPTKDNYAFQLELLRAGFPAFISSPQRQRASWFWNTCQEHKSLVQQLLRNRKSKNRQVSTIYVPLLACFSTLREAPSGSDERTRSASSPTSFRCTG